MKIKAPGRLLKILILLELIFFTSLKVNSQDTLYHGFKCLEFSFEGHDAKIVFPQKAEEQRHWIWRARFWGHEPQTEIALLEKGFHVVYIDAAEYCGNQEAVMLWNHFYEYLVNEYDLNSRAVLEGFSRGGLYVYNWGSENPGKVACIYADAPVCDIKSWPGGKGKGIGSQSDWQHHLQAYGLTEETVDDFRGMPVFKCRKLAEAKIPVLHVCGATDEIVPVDENTYALERTYKEAGGDIKIILKEGIGHHPHSLKDPDPIVRFILSNTSPGLLSEPEAVESKMAIRFRGNIDNCRIKFEKSGKGRVAFLGGSITWNPGWRDMLCNYLKERFPSTEFEFINAGIPSLGSVPGAMRFYRDVLNSGTVDLLFEEAAVNDHTNEVPPVQQIRGMEGIVYHAIKSNPYMDVVIMHFADQDKMADYNNGRIPGVIKEHEKVVDHYNISSINLAKEVNDRVLNGEFTWRDDFVNLHPSEFGQKLYFRTIKYFFDTSWKEPVAEQQKVHLLPTQLYDNYSYIKGHFLPLSNAKTLYGWKIVENWRPGHDVPVREGFVDVPVLEAIQAGASLELSFRGKAIGLFVTSGPDAGIVEFSIDGSEFRAVDQFTKWSTQLHLPWLIMLDDELENGRHRLILRISAEKNKESTGNACRIHQFVVN